jgi:asparagine synthase (glutamine-hydrolysing)
MNAALKPPVNPILHSASSARLRGWIDVEMFRKDPTPAVVDLSHANVVTMSAPWLDVQMQRGAGDSHHSERCLVFVLGHPTVDRRPVAAAGIAAALEAGSSLHGSLGGRFALVAFDLVRKEVLLLTDRFAVWPVCWSRQGARLSFSDRADSVPSREAPALDAQALFNYVYFHMIPAPRTVFLGVSRLDAAASLEFDGTKLSLARTWLPRFSGSRDGTVADLTSEFRQRVADSVRNEAADHQSVGCFLSGGTDSSTVAGMLRQVRGSVPTFSIGFDQRGYDEMEYARIAARHFSTDHYEHYVTPAELVAAVPAVAAHYDQPFGNSSAVPAFICARLARDRGVSKLLAGDGGDELFGGNSRYAKQKIFEAWWTIPAPMRQGIAPLIANGLVRRVPLARKAASYVDQASVPMPARLETYNLLKRFSAATVFTNQFLENVAQAEPSRLQSEVYARHADAPFVDRMLAYDWRFTLADNDLPKVTGTTQLAGVDVGFPLLSDRLVDLSLRLAPSDKVRGLQLRYFFKASLADFLPQKIIDKKKHGFGLPVGPWLVSDPAFRSLARDSVAGLSERGVIRSTLVDDLFSRRLEEHAGYYGEMIWVLMMMEQWLMARAANWKPAR